MEPEFQDAIAELLATEFNEPATLNAFLADAQLGDIAGRLRQSSDLTVYAAEVVQALDRRGLISRELLDSLRQAAPDLDPLISEVEADLGLADTELEPTSSLSIGLDLDEPAGPATAWPAPSTAGDSALTQASRGLRPEQLSRLAEAAKAVVRIVTDQRPLATGFFVTPTLVLTADYNQHADLLGLHHTDDPMAEPTIVPIVSEPRTIEAAHAMFLRVEAGTTPVTPMELSNQRPKLNSPIFVIHHPGGGSKQVNAGTLDAYGASGRDEVMWYTLATRPGSGGGPVLDERLQVVGWVYARSENPTPSGSSGYGPVAAAALSALESLAPDLWRELLQHQPHLQRIDHRVQRAIDASHQDKADGAVPEQLSVIVHLAASDIDVSDVTGFEVTSRWGNRLTGLARPDALAALTQHDGVVGIDASRDGGSVDTRVCLPAVGAPIACQSPAIDERGERCLVAVIDTGADVFHDAFTDEAGATRIEAFWDQTAGTLEDGMQGGSAIALETATRWGLRYGKLWLKADIEQIRAAGAATESFPAATDMAHGTLVASIAAGRRTGDLATDFFGGVAPAAPLLVVRFVPGDAVDYENAHMDALAFVREVAAERKLPVVVNISSGINSGAHDGSSNLEVACEDFARPGNRLVVKSAGNEGTAARHCRRRLEYGMETSIQWTTEDEDGADILQFWLPSKVRCEFALSAPGQNQDSGKIDEFSFRAFDEILAGSTVQVAYVPYSGARDHRLDIRVTPPDGARIAPGTWTLTCRPLGGPADALIDGWIEINHRSTRFTNPSAEATVTIPGTALDVICVNATNPAVPANPYRDASLGPTRTGDEKPDLTAPGVGVRAAGGNTSVSQALPQDGTSLAAPFVTGAVALVLSRRAKAQPPKPPLRPAQLLALMLNSSNAQPGVNWSNYLGWGRLDITALLAEAERA